MSVTSTAPAAHRAGRGERPSQRGTRRRRTIVALIFLAPALVMLGALVVYPIIFTLIRSFMDDNGFVGLDNYVKMFTNETTFTAIRNNAIWVVVAPILCTVLGLILAVLMDQVRWQTAFKLIVFMPMAISMLAAGVIFRSTFQQDPNLGVVNAAIVSIQHAFGGTSSYPGGTVRPELGFDTVEGAVQSDGVIAVGDRVEVPMVGIRATAVSGAEQAAQVPVVDDAIVGTVFLDVIKGGGGTPGQLEEGKTGLPGIRVTAIDADGSVVASATTDAAGRFQLSGLDPGSGYAIALPAENFAAGAQGIDWLGSALITPVIILSYVWIWAGFAMIMIASGLSAIDRSVIEAARMDGANGWKIFTRITAPLLMPVLVVVFVTLVINVLKIFDLVYVIPPGASKPAANVIAVEMWTVSFGGGQDQGLGSALAVLLLLLVLPSMIISVRRFRTESDR